MKILEDLEAWADDDAASKVYWLSGHLGTGKTTIAHTFSECLDKQHKLGASFFCTRSALHDASRIIPTMTRMLALSNSHLQRAICEVLASDPDVADLNSIPEQFNSLVINPIRRVVDKDVKTIVAKIIVIDAIDECSSSGRVEILIKTILDGVAKTPLKFFITSRPEPHIRKAFHYYSAYSDIRFFTETSLQEVTLNDVRSDIQTYLQNSLSEIAAKDPFPQGPPEWPPPDEFSRLLNLSADLFIYAATAVRYIRAVEEDYRDRLTDITPLGSTHVPPLHTEVIDSLYKHIIHREFLQNTGRGRSNRAQVLAAVVCLQTPLSTDGIASLLGLEICDVLVSLSPLQSVIHASDSGHVTIFHASFREFVIDPERCPGYSVDTIKGHQMLTVKCLRFLTQYLRRNICNLPEDRIGPRRHEIKDPNVIPEPLRYSSLHWEYHLSETLCQYLEDSRVVALLSNFADKHLLHWFECLSALGELESGLKSLSKARTTILVSV